MLCGLTVHLLLPEKIIRNVIHDIGVAAALSALTLTLAPVQAANYGGVGSTYAEVVDPKAAVLNDELASSDAVKEGQAKLLAYKKAVDSIKQDLVSIK